VPGPVLRMLERLWHARDRADLMFGTLVNAYLASGGEAVGLPAGRAYVDVGTFDGYREAIRALHAESELGGEGRARQPIEETA